MTDRSAEKLFWFSVGAVALACGIVGVVLPFVPTTPFVILAVFAFSNAKRSLPRVRTLRPLSLPLRSSSR
ncbi:DUF454 family protein [uncultured Roseobacter sp.]|uniref:DUF454 family protein n=1 Tax=uncultured Roseobacter sp. TaxID=114847 RepID=UPI003451EA4A